MHGMKRNLAEGGFHEKQEEEEKGNRGCSLQPRHPRTRVQFPRHFHPNLHPGEEIDILLHQFPPFWCLLLLCGRYTISRKIDSHKICGHLQCEIFYLRHIRSRVYSTCCWEYEPHMHLLLLLSPIGDFIFPIKIHPIGGILQQPFPAVVQFHVYIHCAGFYQHFLIHRLAYGFLNFLLSLFTLSHQLK